MKKSELPYRPLPTGCLRMPMLSRELLRRALSDSMEWERLCHADFFLDALYYASAEFHRQVTDPERNSTPKQEKSLYKYLSRAATRCTPFGCFAAVGTFNVGERTRLSRPDQLPMRPYFTIETSFLEKLAQRLAAQPSTLPFLSLKANPTIVKSGKEYHYRACRPNLSERNFIVEQTSLLRSILKQLDKVHDTDRLYIGISKEYDITRDAFDAYIMRLLNSGMIISQLTPQILDAGDYLTILTGIAEKSGNSEIGQQLQECADLLSEININYAAASTLVEEFKHREWVAAIHKGDAALVQVDSYIEHAKENIHTLSQGVVDEMIEFLCLSQLYGVVGNPAGLSQFRSRYEARYENSPMPLLEVMDEESGIGYGDSRQMQPYVMLQGLGNHPSASSRQYTMSVTPVQQAILRAIESVDYDHHSIALERHFMLPESYDPASMAHLGRSFNMMFQVVGDDEAKYAIADLRFCGTSALNLLARFADGSGEIDNLCSDIAHAESLSVSPDEIIGEISHIPYNRASNVLHRHAWDCVTVEYLSPDFKNDKSIPLSDLLVKISGNRIGLYSRRLKKRIIPRIASAHNYHNNTGGLYKFMGELQSQGNRLSNPFNWGNIEGILTHLPRLTYKRIIVQPEKWKINIGSCKSKNGNDITVLREQLKKQGCVRYILFREGDNCLWIDTDNDLALSTLIDASKKRQSIWVEEFIEPSDGIGINECILPVVKTSCS